MIKFDIKQKSVVKVLCFILVAAMVLLSSCDTKKTGSAESIAVFVPGVVSGSPVYEMLVSGAEEAVAYSPCVFWRIYDDSFVESVAS